MRKIHAIAKYEFSMQIRRLGFWIFTVLVAILTIYDTIPNSFNLSMSFYKSHYYVAGKIIADGMQFLIIVAMFLIADRILRDKRYKTIDVMMACPVSNTEYILGKFGGNLLTVLSMLTIIYIACIIPQIMFHPTPFDIVPYLLAYVVLGIPAVLFVCGVSTSLPVILKNTKIYYVIFIGYWLICVLIAESIKTPFFKFIGDARKLIFISPGWEMPYRGAYINLVFLIFSSLLSLVIIIRVRNLKGERTL